jgi:hypothetical protein
MDKKLRDLEALMSLMLVMSFWQMTGDLTSRFFYTDREIVAAALGHEPNWGNWQDFHYFKRRQAIQQDNTQREVDREKLRRLVFGEDNDDPESK